MKINVFFALIYFSNGLGSNPQFPPQRPDKSCTSTITTEL